MSFIDIRNSNDGELITVTLGDEYDDELRAKLLGVLRALGASPAETKNQTLAGSQYLERFEVIVDGTRVCIEAETYVGISIIGPASIVRRVRELVGLK